MALYDFNTCVTVWGFGGPRGGGKKEREREERERERERERESE